MKPAILWWLRSRPCRSRNVELAGKMLLLMRLLLLQSGAVDSRGVGRDCLGCIRCSGGAGPSRRRVGSP